jgi:hypothetical protein
MAAAQDIGTPTAPPHHFEPREVRALVRIPADHAKALRWYFGENLIAGIAIASDMGIMLERAALLAIRLSPCGQCGGNVAANIPGSGNAPRKGSHRAAVKAWHLAEAKQARAIYCETRADQQRLLEVACGLLDDGSPPPRTVCGEDLGQELPDWLTKQCPKCQGTGMRERRQNNRGGAVTARPTGSSAHGNPDAMHAIDESALELWSRTSRQLEVVCADSPLARVALGMYYGPGGGSVSCLWRLTEAGDAFLTEEPNPHKVAPDLLLANARKTQEDEPTPRRTAQFSRMARECAEVWDHTCATWVRLNPEAVLS